MISDIIIKLNEIKKNCDKIRKKQIDMVILVAEKISLLPWRNKYEYKIDVHSIEFLQNNKKLFVVLYYQNIDNVEAIIDLLSKDKLDLIIKQTYKISIYTNEVKKFAKIMNFDINDNGDIINLNLNETLNFIEKYSNLI